MRYSLIVRRQNKREALKDVTRRIPSTMPLSVKAVRRGTEVIIASNRLARDILCTWQSERDGASPCPDGGLVWFSEIIEEVRP